MRFSNREEAGRRLAQQLVHYRRDRPVVLGLPRGGVPVAYEVAAALKAPLDVWVVRKVGAPGYAELGVGAVAEGGIVFLNQKTIDLLGAEQEEIDAIVRAKSAEVEARVKLFRGGAAPLSLEGRTIILVDDGIATGGTVQAAVQSLRLKKPRAIVLAVPVAASQSLDELRPLVDDVVCLHSTPALHAIGAWYDDFEQVPDEEVIGLLQKAQSQPRPASPSGASKFEARELSIPIGEASLSGTLSGPPGPKGLVLFAHGSGSSRLSPRNRHVAAALHRFGLATLLFDLLTQQEEQLDEETAELRFDIALLARRLVRVTDWALASPQTHGLPLGYFGASTGAAAALVAAADRPAAVSAVVSRGGRPDLAWESLPEVRAPTLLIVGGEDHQVIELNEAAGARLTNHRLVIVPGATHLFEEPGALDAVARLAGEWFSEHLGRAQLEPPGAHAGA